MNLIGMPETCSVIRFPEPSPDWLAAPDERTPGFFPAFARVSVAVQTLLRERVPSHYFVDPRAFGAVKTAYPMLVYRASQPFRGKMRTELTYDILHPKTVHAFFRTVRPALGEVLAATQARLHAEGLGELAALYEPSRANSILESVQRLSKSRKCLFVLIRAESGLVTTLIDLAGLGSLPLRQQARRMSLFEKKWRYQLRRMYPATDFTWLASELLETATKALAQAEPSTDGESRIQKSEFEVPTIEQNPDHAA
jgi:hypothetical protein